MVDGGRRSITERMGMSREANLWRMSSIREVGRVWISTRVN